jgi:hypothetical protein
MRSLEKAKAIDSSSDNDFELIILPMAATATNSLFSSE